jgi:cytochrome c oxidase subunit IV
MDMAGSSTHKNSEIHEIAYNRYFIIWLGLMALTCITVSLAGINLGRLVVITALTIAGIKSLLVLSVFMHLKFETRVFRIFLLVAVCTFVIFIGLTFADYAFY